MSAKNATVQILAALVVLLCACSAEPRVLAVDTATPDEIFPNAALFGTLGGRVNQDGTACFYAGGDAAVTWPQGSFAEADPLAVYDSAGKRIAAMGDYVLLSGGRLPAPGKVPVKGCSGMTFSATGLFVKVVPAPGG